MNNNTEYQKYWAANSERVLAEDELRHNMNMKWAVKKAISNRGIEIKNKGCKYD